MYYEYRTIMKTKITKKLETNEKHFSSGFI